MTPWELMQRAPARPEGFVTAFDPATKSPLGVLSSGDLRLGLSTTNKYANARTVAPLPGLTYYSCSWNRGGSNNAGIGVCDAAVALSSNSNYVGVGNSVGVWFEGRVYQNGSITHQAIATSSNQTIEIAVRAADRRVWLRLAGGAWIGGGNPELNTTPTGTLGGTGSLYIAASIDGVGVASGVVTLPASAGAITGSPPAGFTAGL